MIDLHTHLFWKSYDADRDDVVKRAREGDVEKMLVVGTTLEESKLALEVARKYNLKATLGVHPHEFNDGGSASDGNLSFIEEFKKRAEDSAVVAIGECGLDYFSHNPEKNISEIEKRKQREGFLAQLDLARELKLPVIVHCRDAYEDMLEVLNAKPYTLNPIILHCYMGDTEVTKRFLELPNAYFSFTGNITYPVKKHVAGTKDDLTETVKMIPLERMFTETDCPFLTPQPKRGKRNEPAYVRYVVEKIAELQRVPVTEVERVVEMNYRQIFEK